MTSTMAGGSNPKTSVLVLHLVLYPLASHTRLPFIPVTISSHKKLDQMWANHGLGAIRSRLNFLIWPAEVEEMLLIVSKS